MAHRYTEYRDEAQEEERIGIAEVTQTKERGASKSNPATVRSDTNHHHHHHSLPPLSMMAMRVPFALGVCVRACACGAMYASECKSVMRTSSMGSVEKRRENERRKIIIIIRQGACIYAGTSMMICVLDCSVNLPPSFTVYVMPSMNP